MVIHLRSILGERRSPQKEGRGPAVGLAVGSSSLRPAAWRSKSTRSTGSGSTTCVVRSLAGECSTQPVPGVVTSSPIRRDPARAAKVTRQRADPGALPTRGSHRRRGIFRLAEVSGCSPRAAGL
jgi:hypothetical protein